MKTPAEFDAWYETGLRPVLSELENGRRKICTTFLSILGGTAALAAAMSAVLAAGRAGMIFVVLLIAGGIVALAWWWLTRNYVRDFKERVIGALIRFYDPSLCYTPDGQIAQEDFAGSRIFPHRIDRYTGEDYVEGTIGKTALQFSEVHAQYRTETTDHKGNRRTQWHTIFKGVLFMADFNKDFHGVTVVLPDVAQRLFGFLGQKLQDLNMTRPNLIKLEDPEFEKRFVVYGDDQIESRYILSTSLLRRIVDYREKTGKALHLSFVGSRIYVAITTGKNLFEPFVFRSVMNIDLMRGYLDDLEMVLALVEDLNLNTRIWTKA